MGNDLNVADRRTLLGRRITQTEKGNLETLGWLPFAYAAPMQVLVSQAPGYLSNTWLIGAERGGPALFVDSGAAARTAARCGA